jgi:hypothetical protein
MSWIPDSHLELMPMWLGGKRPEKFGEVQPAGNTTFDAVAYVVVAINVTVPELRSGYSLW